GRLHGVYRGFAEGWSLGGQQPPFSEFDCHYGSPRKWQAPSARRSLCRRERTAGRLLHHRRARPRCRNLLGISVPGRGSWRRRGACVLGGVGVSGALEVAGRLSVNSHERDTSAHQIADAVARRSYGKLVAFLAARTRDVVAAEDALSDAFASALTDWPRS